jgi:hypothetical protein
MVYDRSSGSGSMQNKDLSGRGDFVDSTERACRAVPVADAADVYSTIIRNERTGKERR